MTIEENKAIVRRVYDAINARNPDALDDLIAADVGGDTRFHHSDSGLAGYKESFAAALAAFPDYSITIDDQIAEGDKVVTRYTVRGTQEGEFMGVAPSHEPIELIGIDIDRVADGKVVEHWSEADIEDLMVQLGVTLPRSPVSPD